MKSIAVTLQRTYLTKKTAKRNIVRHPDKFSNILVFADTNAHRNYFFYL